jgi:hypothetical protein
MDDVALVLCPASTIRLCPVFVFNLVLLSSEGQEFEAREPTNDHIFEVTEEELDANVLPRYCVVFKRSGNEVIFVYF